MRLHLVDWLHLLAINFAATFRTEEGAKKREGGREGRERERGGGGGEDGRKQRRKHSITPYWINPIMKSKMVHDGIPPNDKIPFHIFYQMS